MAIKVEISFKVYRGGFRIRSVRRATFVNNWQDTRDWLLHEIEKEIPDIRDVDLQVDRNSQASGNRTMIGRLRNLILVLQIDKLKP